MEFPQIDPVILHIYGPFALRWYALTYLVGIAAAWYLGNRRAKDPKCIWTQDEISDFIFWGFVGIVVGGRVGYVLFYQFSHFLSDPIYLFRMDEGGMSFHGGMLGVIAAFFLFARKSKKSFWSLADFIAPFAPIGLGAGRIGNFINAELYGRPTDLESTPWAMIFPTDPEKLYRHPSQLYEFALEGVVLFILLYWYSAKPRPRKAVSGLFLLGYGTFRFIVEYFREPDEHLKHMAEWLTMGQVLSAPMIVLGLVLVVWAYKDPVYDIAEPGSKKNNGKKQKAQKNK
ncbi:prolipoprotein diacylglyceryl transferase [Pleionea sediminis]|uniref:prolipoprotein diacylglyceryl transferase n=1 Tax=Pleionea sediminis TaxID=2569479 RepID=UPI0011860C6D|nr:prolipoprotein diacylglyceryl transferase [Pleionea sediminis]